MACNQTVAATEAGKEKQICQQEVANLLITFILIYIDLLTLLNTLILSKHVLAKK